MDLALLGGAALALLLALHPFTTYPLTLVALSFSQGRKGQAATFVPASSPPEPEVAVVCCAHNEEKVIDAKVENLLALKRRGYVKEILIYSDGSTDGTLEKLRRHEGEIAVIHSDERQGKSAGMNVLVGHVTAPLVLFTDANVFLDEDAPRVVAERFRDQDLGCLCGTLTYVNADESPTAATNSVYWRLEEKIKQLETRTGSTMGADGSLFAIHRALYRPVPPNIIDDMYTSLSILCDGYKLESDTALMAYERTSTESGDEFRRKVRISCQAFNCHRLLWPRLRSLPMGVLYKYLSHKVLRWFTAFNLVLASVLFAGWAAANGFLGLLSAQGAIVALLLLSRVVRIPLVSSATEALLALLATGLGVMRSVQGEQFQTWEIAGSGR